MATPSLANYLSETKVSSQALDDFKNITLVIGNESADLDSVVSAVIYAYYLFKAKSKKTEHEDGESIVLPLVWCHRDDIELRTEVVALFKEFSIDLDSLLYRNQLPSSSVILNERNVEVVLVDHNHSGEHKELNDYVVEIIDHHEDTNSFQKVIKNIQTVGSCSTLIAQKIHYEDSNFLDSPLVSEFLLAAIFMDTFNLDLHSGRTTEQDVFIAEILSSHTEFDSDNLFSILQTAKMDISTMSTYNILRKDYKPVQCTTPEPSRPSPKLGISSATIEANVLLTREDFLETVQTYMKALHLDALIIMFLSFGADSQAHRKLAVVSDNEKLKNKMCDFFKQEKDLVLVADEMEGLDENVSKCIHVYTHNVKWSRKKVMPAVGRFVTL